MRSANAKKCNPPLGGVRTLLEAAEILGVIDATLDELAGVHAQSRVRAEELAGAVGLMRQVLSVTDRDPAAVLDVRAEALAASFLRNVQAFPHAKAHLRSMRLAEDGVLEDIRIAHGFATAASDAASEAEFGEPPTAALAASLPSAREMRAAAAVIKSTSFVGRFFSGDGWRAKATWRQSFPGEKMSGSSAVRLVAAAKWKEGLESLEGCLTAKDAIASNWRGSATPFADILAVGEWMRAVQKVTPSAVDGARALRRLLFDGASEDIRNLAEARAVPKRWT